MEITAVKSEKVEKKKITLKFNKKKNSGKKCSEMGQWRHARASQGSIIFCGQELTGPVSESYGEIPTTCINNIQEWSSHV